MAWHLEGAALAAILIFRPRAPSSDSIGVLPIQPVMLSEAKHLPRGIEPRPIATAQRDNEKAPQAHSGLSKTLGREI